MCRHIYDWNIVKCDVKQPYSLTHDHAGDTEVHILDLNPPGPHGGVGLHGLADGKHICMGL